MCRACVDGLTSRHAVGGNAPAARRGEDRKVDSRGYIQIRTDRPGAYRWGWELEHRVVAEEMLGRSLEAGEVVHHRDRDRQNNDPNNLEVMTDVAHKQLHYPKGSPVA